MIIVPPDFAIDHGDDVLAWRDTLPALATEFCARWELTPDGDLMNGYVAVVLPVRRADGTAAVLKLTWLDKETRQEPLALRAWNGDGVVRLLDSDDERGALLLERLDHTQTLLDTSIEEALEVTGGLLRRLRLPAGPQFRRVSVDGLAEENANLGGIVPDRFVGLADELGRELTATAGNTLVNQDLHYENVLRADREPWLMIDPKPVAGDREFGVVPLLWNRADEVAGERGVLDRMAALCDLGELDAERTRLWTLYRAVDNWLWCTEAGEHELAGLSEVIARALIQQTS
ncbi:aminoglycoside phosphotransferase family protein [Actinosynnema sp. NPDC047251]|uniref:Aminoglycoside/hydroxyurea antibiotic resistance kinase n=1 Tax=Saccharothrix espanaensis (strain ATCC 51144 / DSM 44229 / JCM 9112 / NBRC 15066 / NRRL 15764) TaxID=1179773 RepID=K0JP42_SACES|nr:aminoglycoside phosphotransferase family protein [Saccharothrix espanaensis]CCH28220.1 Aminoglycoside/hydroxyurea antibiotic resistance kinase [Saccharothrix espanaensis DSM 44229]